ncbi:MAG: Serine/threonine-protein kinase PknD [Gemmatimonadaceae bacterium]|nr:Serine/threonine-protein kinase PknD [Gemmatimonadaceae bacterium]
MGIVYLARDRRLKRQVAIKLLPPELAFRSEIRSRFLKEAETAAQLSHPNIVPIYSVDEREGLVYFVMAFVDGENLAVRLHREGALSPDEARRILLEVARALAYAHERGVVHRDIKPDNILTSASDGSVMVTDFGIARAVSEGADARLTATGMAIGTPAYMSPEQSMGERQIDGRSDLYSLGVVGYQMLSGDLPFSAASTPALLVKQISEHPTPLSDRCPRAPADLARAVMLMLEKDPANRFATAAALVQALETGIVPEAPARPKALAPVHQKDQARAVVAEEYRPSSEEVTRWNAPAVVHFRKKLAPFFAFSAVSVLLAIVNVLDGLVGVAGIWSVFLAFQYAKLWTEGYDWRDVFKEPRDRLFFDVVAEWMDSVRALWDGKKRAEIRERTRLRGGRGPELFARQPSAALPSGGLTGRELDAAAGRYASVVRDALRNRDDALRNFQSLPRSDRDSMSEIPETAQALFSRIEALAMNLADLERNAPDGGVTPIEDEIRRLEAQANPLDVRNSEERVRRLAFLKRQRRAVSDVSSKIERSQDRLDRCVLALQNIRLDLMRLKAGSQTVQQVTLVAERAMDLAREVENAAYVQEEMAKLTRRPVLGGGPHS